MSEQSPPEEVRRYFELHPVPPGSLLVVAVSGGPDSVCLLHVLFSLRKELSVDLHVAHLDHRLRGAESDADAAYVKRLAQGLGLPATIGQHDVAGYRREHKLSLEEAAREVRYAFLEDVVRQTGAYAAAVGHTADDRAETVIMNILRGAGTRGLRGLLPFSRRNNGEGVVIIRPLLEVNREQTVAYCRIGGLRPRSDLSNLSGEYTRNRVRHSLMPFLRDYNPRVREALLKLAHFAADDTDYIADEVKKIQSSVMSVEKETAVIDRKAFLALHPALQRGILREAVLAVRGTLKDIEAGHIGDMLEAAQKSSGKIIMLPDGLAFVTEYSRYVLAADSSAFRPLPEVNGETTLMLPGITELPGWEVIAEISGTGEEGRAGETGSFTVRLDHEKTGSVLTVRTRRTGDRFRPLGLDADKKLGEFMIDEHIPRAWRDRVPLVTSPQGIAWVVGYRIDDRFRVTEKTARILRLEFRRTF